MIVLALGCQQTGHLYFPLLPPFTQQDAVVHVQALYRIVKVVISRNMANFCGNTNPGRKLETTFSMAIPIVQLA